jgi:GH18 family chitinase
VIDLRKEANARPRYQDRPVIITYPAGNINTNIDKVTPHDVRMAGLVDQYNFMSYGVGWFGQGWASNTFSPLTGHTEHRPVSIAGTIQAYVDAGVPRAKLGIGLAFYGCCWQGVTGPGQDGGRVAERDGAMSYRTLVAQYPVAATRQWDTLARVPYLSSPTPIGPAACTFVSYDDAESVAAKAAYARAQGLGGVIIWTLGQGHVPSAPPGQRDPLLDALRTGYLQ